MYYLVCLRIVNCDGDLCTDDLMKNAAFKITFNLNADTPQEAQDLAIQKCCVDLNDHKGPVGGRFTYSCLSIEQSQKAKPGNVKVTPEELAKIDRTAKYVKPKGSKAERTKITKPGGGGHND